MFLLTVLAVVSAPFLSHTPILSMNWILFVVS